MHPFLEVLGSDTEKYLRRGRNHQHWTWGGGSGDSSETHFPASEETLDESWAGGGGGVGIECIVP